MFLFKNLIFEDFIIFKFNNYKVGQNNEFSKIYFVLLMSKIVRNENE